MSTLREKYVNEVAPGLKERLGMKNQMSVPRLLKVVVNMGIGIADKDAIKNHVEELGVITGQRPAITKSKKSISNFKLREDMDIGAKVTLRGVRMYEFLDRLINAALPRIRDFRGLPKTSFDGHGNYSMGITDQSIFPELDPDKIKATQGMDITIVTSAKNNSDASEMLSMMGMPFSEKVETEEEPSKKEADRIPESPASEEADKEPEEKTEKTGE